MANSTLQAEVEGYRQIQQEIQSHYETLQKLGQQKSENEMVLKELEGGEEDAKVFKLVGPALVRQELGEAKANVAKRLEFIGKETAKLDSIIASLQEKGERKRKAIEKLQAGSRTTGIGAGAVAA